MNAKHRAAEAALKYVKSGMTVGLGTGSTAKIFIDLLGQAIRTGQLTNIRGLPTSVRSEEQARQLGIEVVDFSIVESVDVTIDGADEVSPALDLIKGLGGALLREKVVAQNSRKLIIIVDDSKLVPHLCGKGRLPVEVAPFSRYASERFLRSLDGDPVLRLNPDNTPYVTDNGNFIFDCMFPPITQPGPFDQMLRDRAGIVETGLFVKIASVVIVADDQDIHELKRDDEDEDASEEGESAVD